MIHFFLFCTLTVFTFQRGRKGVENNSLGICTEGFFREGNKGKGSGVCAILREETEEKGNKGV